MLRAQERPAPARITLALAKAQRNHSHHDLMSNGVMRRGQGGPDPGKLDLKRELSRPPDLNRGNGKCLSDLDGPGVRREGNISRRGNHARAPVGEQCEVALEGASRSLRRPIPAAVALDRFECQSDRNQATGRKLQVGKLDSRADLGCLTVDYTLSALALFITVVETELNPLRNIKVQIIGPGVVTRTAQ